MAYQQAQEPIFTAPWFSLRNASLTIHETDTEEPIIPDNTVEENERGRKKWYKKQRLTSDTSKHWRKTIADVLVHKFLLMDAGNHTKYVLTDFPPGYYLYTHIQTTDKLYDDPRRDTYLFGGGHKFRSTHEAMYHLAWLMSGRELNRCRCIYDNPDRSVHRKQGNLNKVFLQEWRDFQNNRLKEKYEAYRRRTQTNQPYQAPPRSVNAFNEAMFLRPSA